ncbi:MAG: N-acetylmuramoyl-L-alanine amidase-like domain-containing protein [Anaeromyxobacteraceae bacterium]
MALLPLVLALTALTAHPSAPAPLLRALSDAPPGAARAVAATASLVGRRYLLSALGEGVAPDRDPRFRLDAFDCVTFVETAVALGASRTLDEAARILDDVRYDGAPAFDRRNHYVVAQWTPANVAHGWIEDVADAVAGEDAVDVVEQYDDLRWTRLARAGATIPHLAPEAWPRGTFRARMVPVARVLAHADRIPEGTIAWVVRVDAPLHPTRVTHAGLVVVGPRGDRRVRHATASVGTMRVIEEPLDRFLRRQERAHPGWPLSGLLLQRIRANPARAESLGTGGGLGRAPEGGE